MRAGDLLLTPSWHWHGHHHVGDEPMAWLDGLDIPLVKKLDASFFEFGDDGIEDKATPDKSRSERLWAHSGRRPLSALENLPNSPLMAYRWADTDAALAAQLELEDEGYPGVYEPGHAALRFTNPMTRRGRAADAAHRDAPAARRDHHQHPSAAPASAVWQTFRGRGNGRAGRAAIRAGRGRPDHRAGLGPAALHRRHPAGPVTFNDHRILEVLNLYRDARLRTGPPVTTLPPWDTVTGWATQGQQAVELAAQPAGLRRGGRAVPAARLDPRARAVPPRPQRRRAGQPAHLGPHRRRDADVRIIHRPGRRHRGGSVPGPARAARRPQRR